MIPEDSSLLEKQLEDVTSLSDSELEELRSRFLSSANDTKHVDLEAYTAARNGEDTRSGLQKAVDSVKTFFGYTPQKRFGKLVQRAEQLHATYSRRVKGLAEITSEQADELIRVGKEREAYKGEFSIIQEQFVRQREKLDRMEAESESVNGSSRESYDLRERIIDASKELRVIRHEANRAMKNYTSSAQRYKALSAQHERVSQKLIEFERQETGIAMLISEWNLQREVSVGGPNPSMMEQYEEIGMLAQKINGYISENFSRNAENQIDTMYRVSSPDMDGDPLVERWKAIRD